MNAEAWGAIVAIGLAVVGWMLSTTRQLMKIHHAVAGIPPLRRRVKRHAKALVDLEREHNEQIGEVWGAIDELRSGEAPS